MSALPKKATTKKQRPRTKIPATEPQYKAYIRCRDDQLASARLLAALVKTCGLHEPELLIEPAPLPPGGGEDHTCAQPGIIATGSEKIAHGYHHHYVDDDEGKLDCDLRRFIKGLRRENKKATRAKAYRQCRD